MDILALAPGVRLALQALGFKPEEIVALMKNIGDGIAGVKNELAEIRSDLAAIKAQRAQKEEPNGPGDQSDHGDGTEQVRASGTAVQDE